MPQLKIVLKPSVADDLIDKVAEKLKKSKSQNEGLSIIAEFLPDPIRDTLNGWCSNLRNPGQQFYCDHKMAQLLWTTIQDTNNNYNTPVLTVSLEPDKRIKFTPDYKASESIFWDVFKELSKDNNGRLVAYDKLQERLISTGKLDAGASVLMIDRMDKTGKIEKTEEDSRC